MARSIARSRDSDCSPTFDVQATLKSKIGADSGKYRILGACNPQFAHEALKIEDKLGVLLPCNVIVRETSDQQVEVAGSDVTKARELLERAEHGCLIANSLRGTRTLETQVVAAESHLLESV